MTDPSGAALPPTVFVVDDDRSRDDSADEPRVQVRPVEAVARVVLAERCLAGDRGRGRRRPEHLDVVGVLGEEAFEVARVVGIELALHRRFG